jgi:hypothetical protein
MNSTLLHLFGFNTCKYSVNIKAFGFSQFNSLKTEVCFPKITSVNKQNFRYWSAMNPKEIHERSLHSYKVTVWCAVSSFGIIGPCFFEDEWERAVTVTGPRYVHMLENFLAPLLGHLPVNEDTFILRDRDEMLLVDYPEMRATITQSTMLHFSTN